MRRSIVCLSILLLVFSVNLSSVDKKAFTIDDLYRVKNLSGLEISPDGKKLLFSVTDYSLKQGTSDSDVFLLNLGNGNLKQLTFNKSADFNPFWSSDGGKIYFISSRDEGDQLWEMDADGGEARKMSDFYTGISSPLLGNGTGKLFFTSSVFAECMEDGECNKKMSEKLENGTAQAHMADSLLYRHWNFYRDWQYTHLFCMDINEKKVKAITKGRVDFPPFSLIGNGFDISPDGGTVCIVSNFDKDLAHSTNSDLFIIDLKVPGAEPVNITADNKAHDGSPGFSPDGRWLAYLTQKVPGYESDRFRLAVYDLKGKQTRILTDPIDNWVDIFKWSPDSAYLYFTVQEKGYSPLYRVNLKCGIIEPMIERQSIRDFQITPDGRQVVFSRSSVGEPIEIWSYRVGVKNSLKRMTFVNKTVEDEVDFRPAEEHWTEGAEGKPVHIFLVKPHDFDPSKKYPLILNIHGGPQSQWMDSFRGDWQVYPGSGYIVAFPNPHGSTGYGQAYTDAIARDWNGRVMEDIDKVSQYLAQLPFVDSDRMGAMGWSWGGYAMMWLEGHNKYFKAFVSMMGIYDARCMYSATEELWYPGWDLGGPPWENQEFYKQVSPSSYVKNFKTPCLIITGERDYRVPYNMSMEFFTDLQGMGVPSRLIIFKNDGHWPNHVKSMPVYYNAHLEWFHIYLKGDAAPYETEKMIRNTAFEKEK